MKNKYHAFTLMEVMLAMGILAISMTLLSTLQTKSVFRVLRGREQIERIYLIKEQVYKAWIGQPKKSTEKPDVIRRENPETKIENWRKQITKKSALAQFEKDIQIVSTTGSWKSGPWNRSMTIASFVFQPRKKADE